MKFISSKGLFVSIVIASTVSLVTMIVENIDKYKEERRNQQILEVKNSINNSIFTSGTYLQKVEVRDKKFNIEYTYNQKMKKYAEKLLKRYRSDHSAIVILDNNTGDIIAAAGYNKEDNRLDHSLPFSTTHPSASLFKIVTSAGLLMQTGVSPETVFSVRGRGTTLYKYQLKDKIDRWTRFMSLERAFAYSNNVVFGKAAIKKLTGSSIYHTANLMGFNRKLTTGLNLGRSQFVMPEDQYNLAEKASGFTKKTLISPVHAALLSSIIINEGSLVYPRLIKSISTDDGKFNWVNKVKKTKALERSVALNLQELMKAAVVKGTARALHRGIKRKFRSKLKFGGKTGTITGGLPYGKRDWLTVYAAPQDITQGKGISVAVMNINVKKWYVKSTFLAKKLINYYYKEVFPKLRSDLSRITENKVANKGV